MNQIRLAFVANDGIAYAPETEIGKQLGYISWTPSKIRVILSDDYDDKTIHISQGTLHNDELVSELTTLIHSLKKDNERNNNLKYENPQVLFYNNFDDLGTEEIDLRSDIKSTKYCTSDNNIQDVRSIDFYVGGKFKNNVIYGGASAQDKDIKIVAEVSGKDYSNISTMIRVRRNANELTTKAKKDYIEALTKINEKNEEGDAIGIYSKDFFAMHVKGSKSIAHGTEVFLPWHRLYILDIERQLQIKNPDVSLHYWKFDEAAPNVFKQDFMGESVIDLNALSIQGLSLNFAKFDDNNLLKKWAINNEKLIRRKALFNFKKDPAGFNGISVLSEHDTLLGKTHLRKNILDEDGEIVSDSSSISLMEDNPHGFTHVSHVGYINYVPTAPKDPIFFFLHSNVERLYTKWQNQNNLYDPNSNDVYENLDPKIEWKNKENSLWPWNGRPTPNDFHLDPPGNRANNFTNSNLGKIFKDNAPSIEDALDAFGIFDFNNYLGFGYDDSNTIKNNKVKFNQIQSKNTIVMPSSRSIVKILNDFKKISDFGTSSSKLLSHKEENEEKLTLKSTINEFVLKSISSSQLNANSPQISSQLEQVLRVSENIEIRDSIVNTLVLKENRDIIHQIEQNFYKLKIDLKDDNKIKFYDEKSDENIVQDYSKYLTFYLLSLYDYNFISDLDRVETIKNNKDYLKNINNEEVLDLKITLYSFASNSTIKNDIIPIFFPKGEGLDNYLSDLEEKSKGSDSLSNKYWALHTLLTNAGVGQ